MSALQLVFAGGIYVPPSSAQQESSMTAPESARCRPPSLADGTAIDVLALMMQGKSNKAFCP